MRSTSHLTPVPVTPGETKQAASGPLNGLSEDSQGQPIADQLSTPPIGRKEPTIPPNALPGTPSDLLTIDQAAERMNMSSRYVRRLIAGRGIPFHKLGRAVRLTAADVDAHIHAGRVEPITHSTVWQSLRSVA